MTSYLHKIFASKRSFRRELAARDIMDKLAMLDALRERTLALRGACFSTAVPNPSTVIREDPTPYRIAKD